jgi:hypothetical protein
MYTEREIKW